MRARAVVIASAASVAVLVTGWQLGTAGTDAGTTAASNGATSTNGGTDASSSASNGSATSGGTTDATDAAATDSTANQAASSGVADGTYAGSTVGTRFGDVQVQVTISGGTITDVTPLQLTDHDGRSVSISNRAAPILRDEVLQAQSASVSFVGGATYTSAGYVQSLQAALDAAGF